MYQVNKTTFYSFTEAVAEAKKLSVEVFEAATGQRRWAPAAAVSSNKARIYRERMAAYKAYKASMAQATA